MVVEGGRWSVEVEAEVGAALPGRKKEGAVAGMVAGLWWLVVAGLTPVSVWPYT